MLPEAPKPKRGRPRKFDTDDWYKYVGDANIDLAVAMKSGEALQLEINTRELESAKWQWYKTFKHMGVSRKYTISMDHDNAILRITKRYDSTASPTATITKAQDIAPPGQMEWSTSQASLYRNIVETMENKLFTQDQLIKAVHNMIAEGGSQAPVGRALAAHYNIPLPPLDQTSPDEEDPELEAMMNKVLEEEEKP
jgi:hypothetical protein